MRTRYDVYDQTQLGLKAVYKRLVCALVASVLLFSVKAMEPPVLGGRVRGQAWFSLKEPRMSALYGEWGLALSGKTGQVFYKTDLRIRDGLCYDKRQTDLELKEAFVGYRTDWLETSLGKRVFGWGRVDGYNPTNNLTAFDYFRLSDNPDDQKLGAFQWLLSVRPFDGSALTLVWQPLFVPSIYRYDLFDMGNSVVFKDPIQPQPNLKEGNVSLRWNVETPTVGFSVSYFNGYDPYHGFDLVGFDLQPTVQVTYRPAYYRKQSVGADLAIPVGAFMLRAEAAYDLTKGYEEKVFVPKPDLNAVVGLETVLAGITTLVQYQATVTTNWEAALLPVLTDPTDPAAQYAYALAMARYETALFNRQIMHQEKASQHALMVSLQRGVAYETVSLGLTGLYDLTTKEYLLRPELAWFWTDALTLRLCGLWMEGPARSLYDYAGNVLGGLCVGLTVTY